MERIDQNRGKPKMPSFLEWHKGMMKMLELEANTIQYRFVMTAIIRTRKKRIPRKLKKRNK